MKYFNDCTTIDEVKVRFKQLAKKHHPDLGGDTAVMQEINKEFAFVSARIIRNENLSEEQENQKVTETERYRDTIEKIIHIPGIVVELVGLWIWVTGDTKPVRDRLKDAGLFYSGKKVAWYYRPEELKGRRGSGKSLNQIRTKYGSETLNSKGADKIEKQNRWKQHTAG